MKKQVGWIINNMISNFQGPNPLHIIFNNITTIH